MIWCESDLTVIDAHLAELHHRTLLTDYATQKLSLETQLKSFLSSLPAPKPLFTAIPLDICRFPVWQDTGRKMQVHQSSCPHLGLHPIRLSYKSVDSFIDKLCAFLNLRTGMLIPKWYLKGFTSEQLQAAITPQQQPQWRQDPRDSSVSARWWFFI